MATTITYELVECVRPADTNEAALYLVPASPEITEINAVLRVCNQDSVAHTYCLAHCKATGAADGSEWIAYDKSIPANETYEYSIHAKAGQEVRIKASIADKISFHLSGMKKVTA